MELAMENISETGRGRLKDQSNPDPKMTNRLGGEKGHGRPPKGTRGGSRGGWKVPQRTRQRWGGVSTKGSREWDFFKLVERGRGGLVSTVAAFVSREIINQ